MDMTATEQIREYAKNLYPIFRPAVLVTGEAAAYNRGVDDTAYKIQKDLLGLLGADDADLA